MSELVKISKYKFSAGGFIKTLVHPAFIFGGGGGHKSADIVKNPRNVNGLAQHVKMRNKQGNMRESGIKASIARLLA